MTSKLGDLIARGGIINQEEMDKALLKRVNDMLDLYQSTGESTYLRDAGANLTGLISRGVDCLGQTERHREYAQKHKIGGN